MTEKKQIDWKAVELEYRCGIKSLKAIGAEFGVSDAGIIKRAKRDEWDRDLSLRIQAKADAKVSADAVSDEVSALTKIAEKQIVEANAELQALVRREQRSDITRSRKLVMSLLCELEYQTENVELYHQLAELLHDSDDKAFDKRNELLNKAISLNSRSGTMKSLTESLKTLVGLEREAFGIDTTARFGAHETAIDDLA